MAYEGMDFKEWIGEYPVHPVASLFPMIDDDASMLWLRTLRRTASVSQSFSLILMRR